MTFQEFHDKEGTALVFTDVVQRADMRVVDR
jgi:hypothetical protein